MKKIFIVLISLMLLTLTGCGSKNPIATLEIKDYGNIEIELYPDIAPNTVANFVNLIESGYYNDNTIHRIQKDFVIQGGDKTATGNGGPGYSIKGEFKENGFVNNLSHVTGVISMARAQDPNSAGSQFFIVLSDSAKTSLDGKYAAFGKVINGLDIIQKLNEEYGTNEKMGMLDKPLTITSATVETFGKTYTVKKISE